MASSGGNSLSTLHLVGTVAVTLLLSFAGHRLYDRWADKNLAPTRTQLTPGAVIEKPILTQRFPLKTVTSTNSDPRAKFVADAIFGEFLVNGAVSSANGVEVNCDIQVSTFLSSYSIRANCRGLNYQGASVAAAANLENQNNFQETAQKAATLIAGKFREQLLSQQKREE